MNEEVSSRAGTRAKARRSRVEATAIPEKKPYQGPATRHVLNMGDARKLDWIEDESVHLVITSPPYFNLKKYNDHPDQLGAMDAYKAFHDELDRVWQHCYRALVPGGRLVCSVHGPWLSQLMTRVAKASKPG
jgi:tRNA1(Val) A37 N6-methylase TrmN6